MRYARSNVYLFWMACVARQREIALDQEKLNTQLLFAGGLLLGFNVGASGMLAAAWTMHLTGDYLYAVIGFLAGVPSGIFLGLIQWFILTVFVFSIHIKANKGNT